MLVHTKGPASAPGQPSCRCQSWAQEGAATSQLNYVLQASGCGRNLTLRLPLCPCVCQLQVPTWAKGMPPDAASQQLALCSAGFWLWKGLDQGERVLPALQDL